LKVQYLEQLVRALREHGLVESTRGAHGGYRLVRPPEEMRMSEIVRALEGPIAPMICATEGEMEVICERLDGCSTKFLWAHVRDAVTAALDALTLADVLRANEANESERARRAPNGVQLISLSPRLTKATALDSAGHG
jgi:Rrf2 family cysteine metabolism transcriptional repressor